jgi:hypothetical protein
VVPTNLVHNPTHHIRILYMGYDGMYNIWGVERKS